ncbi:ABC transporter permease [Corynebacterium pacaense]|uniref:ABC transporter permease n=1 Tax=Corynebacterium pacaense TaxID=1816684 RepID=UPI0009BA90FB|nr:ABC transporter permease [Corynebacterium pacaense]
MNNNLSWFIRRLAEFVVTLWLISIAAFLIVALAPGDAALSLLRVDDVAMSRTEIEAFRNDMGFNDPLHVRYWDYLTGLLHGDLGTSAMTGEPVLQELLKALPATFILAGLSLLFTAVLVLGLGFLAARYRGGWVDRVVMGLCYFGASIPTFWLGLVLISLLAVRIKVLPASGWHGGTGLILPVLCLGVAIAPPFIKIFRNRFVEVSQEDFVRAVRSRGVRESEIVRRHIIRGSLISVVTMLAVSLGSLLSGSVVVEVVFGLPGMGKLAVEAVTRRDYAVVQGFVLLVGVAILIVMLLVDGLNRLIDPSIRLKERERQ